MTDISVKSIAFEDVGAVVIFPMPFQCILSNPMGVDAKNFTCENKNC